MISTLALASFLVLSPSVRAADMSLGAAVDLAAGAWSGGEDIATVAGVREVEGDLRVRADAFTARVDMDLGVVVGDGGAWIGLVRPEQVTVGMAGKGASLDAGLAPAPWRIESVDRWENTLVNTWRGTEALAPGQVVGGTLTLGSAASHVAVVGGIDRGAGLNLLDRATTYGAVLGLQGQAALGEQTKSNRLVGGCWWRPGADIPGGVQVGFRADVAVAALQAEAIGRSDGVFGAQIQAEGLSRLPVTPVGRLSWLGTQPGITAGVKVKPFPGIAFKAEAGWENDQLAGWVEAAAWIAASEPKAGRKSRK